MASFVLTFTSITINHDVTRLTYTNTLMTSRLWWTGSWTWLFTKIIKWRHNKVIMWSIDVMYTYFHIYCHQPWRSQECIHMLPVDTQSIVGRLLDTGVVALYNKMRHCRSDGKVMTLIFLSLYLKTNIYSINAKFSFLNFLPVKSKARRFYFSFTYFPHYFSY